MRAHQPDRAGYAVNRGVRLYYEVHGTGPLAVLLVPPWAVVTSGFWKMQLPFLARYYTVVLYDPRGNGRSDRPASGYEITDVSGDALAVLDQVGIDRCTLVSVSAGMRTCCYLAADHPQRVSGIAMISGSLYSSQKPATLDEREMRRRRLLEHFDERITLFWGGHFTEPHSTKAQDDGSEWSHETTPEIIAAAQEALWNFDTREVLGRVCCPVLQIHGLKEADHVQAFEGHRKLPHSTLVTMITPGHLPNLRDPVRVNLILREFFDRIVLEDQAPLVTETANARARA